MKNPKSQIVVVAILSLLIAVEAFFLSGAPAKLLDSSSPAANFGRPTQSPSLQRTLRPDGQTESAELVSDWNFKFELIDLAPERWVPIFALDREYISPTASTAKLILKRAFRKLENVYVPEAYDCDDNAQELMVLLRKEALVEYREYPAGLAIGFIGVRIDGPIYEYREMTDDPNDYPMYHAMVVMRLKGGHWLLIEPLSHQVCELTGPIIEGQIVVGLLYF